MIVAVAVTFRAEEIAILGFGWVQVQCAGCDQASTQVFKRTLSGQAVDARDIATMDSELAGTECHILAGEPEGTIPSEGARIALTATRAARDILREAELRIDQAEE